MFGGQVLINAEDKHANLDWKRCLKFVLGHENFVHKNYKLLLSLNSLEEVVKVRFK